MSGVGKTQAVSVHKFRRVARLHERRLQRVLADDSAWRTVTLAAMGVPWAKGVRVEKVGRFCFACIATEERGH